MLLRNLLVTGFVFALAVGLILWSESQSGVQTADATGASIWGDVDCSGNVDNLDVLVLLRNAGSLPVNQPDGCPEIGTTIATTQAATESQLWGDSDCSGSLDSLDALKTLLYLASSSATQTQSTAGTCPLIGASIATEPQQRAILYITGIASDGSCDTPWTLPGLDSDPGWLWISDPLKETGEIAYDDFVEYIYRDGNGDGHKAPDCSSSPDDPFPYYTFDRHDSCWSLDNSIDPDVGGALESPPNGSGAPKGQAEKLRDFIKGYIQAHPGGQLSIIAHSQGGVLAAYTLAKYHSDPDIAKVSNLVTLDSPLQGIRNLAATDLGISQVRSWFFKCDGNDDKRYDSIWDMLPEALSPREVIREITDPGNWTNSTSLYTVNEANCDVDWFGLCEEMIPDSETRFGWEDAHLCVTTGSHAKLANGRGDTQETQKVVDFIKRAILGPAPVANSSCEEDPTYTIEGTVYVDANSNGTKDTGEIPYANATVTLAGIDLTTTDAQGRYSFYGLADGNYTVGLVVPVGYQPTTNILVPKGVPPDATVNFGIEASATPDNHAPNPPSPYFPPDGGTIYSDYQPDMCWTGNGDPDGDPVEYKIVVSKMLVNGDLNNLEFGWIGGNCVVDLGDLVAFLQGLGLESGTFAWHVVARDPSGLLSDGSPCWSSGVDCYGNPWWLYFTLVISEPTQAPEPPSGLQATPLDPYSIQLTWQDNSGNEDGFEITDALTSRFASANSQSYVWGGLQPNAYTCFKIRAYNSAGNSDWEPPNSPYYVCTTTPAAQTPPSAPSNLSVTAPDPYSIQLTWQDNSGNEDGFEITDALTSRFVAANAETYTWGGLAPNTYKCFKIRAYNSAGSSDWEPPNSPYYVCTTTPPESFTVSSQTGWQQTGLYLSSGESVSVSYVSGCWTVDYTQFSCVGPGGYSAGEDSLIFQGCKVNSSLPYGTLLGRVGNGGTFTVGTGGAFVADAEGYLYLRINDMDACLVDNSGSISVNMT